MLHSDIVFELETITPDMAEKILADAGSSGVEDKKAVDAYAAVMAAGGWIVNGMPIIFDPKGKLIDGFQRLAACVQANVPFDTMVARNVRADTLHTIDQHRRRSYTGVLQARGIHNAGAVMRTMSKLIRIENGTLGMETSGLSWSLYDRVLDQNPEIIDAVRLADFFKGSAVQSTARPTLAFMAIKANKQSPYEEFMLGTKPGTTLSLDNPARMISLQMSMARDQDFALDVDTSLAVSIMAFNDFCKKKKVTEHYSWKPDYGKTPLDEKGRPRNRKELKKGAPPNLGLPLVEGYPGLDGEVFMAGGDMDAFSGKTAEELKAGTLKDQRSEQVHMITVTPDMASDWLGRFNKSNRKIMANHIDTIKRDILSENFMVNAQPICFKGNPLATQDAEGNGVRLLNGQHRLMACIAADSPIEVPIAINIPEEAFATYDIHSKRSRLKAGDENVDDRVIAAAARLQWKQDNNISFATRMTPSATELRDTIARHPEMLVHFQRAKKFTKIASAGVMTWFIYHISRENEVFADVFLDGLESGELLESGNPVLSLRTELIGQRGARSRVDVLSTLMTGWEKFKKWNKKKTKSEKDHPRMI